MGSTVEQTKTAQYREIAHRVSTFIEVALLWRQADNSVLLRLVEVGNGVEFELRVPPDHGGRAHIVGRSDHGETARLQAESA